MKEEQTKTNEEIFNELPTEVQQLLKIHFSMISEVSQKDSTDVQFTYNHETKELQFLTKFLFTPKITTDKAINYQEK